MQRLKEEFLDLLEKTIPLDGLTVLEIGAGDGSRSLEIARRCKTLYAIEPDEEGVKTARARNIPNATFEIGSGESLLFATAFFDVVVFTLSFHHIPQEKMVTAINEAVRVVRTSGHVVFLEPTESGSFFDAEIRFDACDGDERKEKKTAYEAMLSHEKLDPVCEINDETVFQFQSLEDFIDSMSPEKSQEEIKSFLESNDYILKAGRRINIFQPA